ncbi:hypothetical protein [Nocardioides sp. SR21]|uniref:hypothetical protein n=1 Tax=Nocardioides sp. SR21 TaxID=2919501 RepID=UPI001FAAAFBA|nr:hypothetical protein [Nocardioides sp. SR21]
MSSSVGLRLKQLVLLFGAVFLGIVALTNLMNLVSAATTDWTFLNSHNTGYVESVVAIYDAPGWLDELVVLAALAIEATGALLFVRALLAYRGGGTGVTETYQALAWNIGVWFAFIVGSEVFLAYDAEGTFRELLALALLMAVVVAVVPDEPTA